MADRTQATTEINPTVAIPSATSGAAAIITPDSSTTHSGLVAVFVGSPAVTHQQPCSAKFLEMERVWRWRG